MYKKHIVRGQFYLKQWNTKTKEATWIFEYKSSQVKDYP